MEHLVSEAQVVGWLIGLVGALFLVLMGLLGWIGNRIHSRLDSIAASLQAIEKDLRDDLTGLDRRVIKLEVMHDMREAHDDNHS